MSFVGAVFERCEIDMLQDAFHPGSGLLLRTSRKVPDSAIMPEDVTYLTKR
jgi:hypothetical protein